MLFSPPLRLGLIKTGMLPEHCPWHRVAHHTTAGTDMPEPGNPEKGVEYTQIQGGFSTAWCDPRERARGRDRWAPHQHRHRHAPAAPGGLGTLTTGRKGGGARIKERFSKFPENKNKNPDHDVSSAAGAAWATRRGVRYVSGAHVPGCSPFGPFLPAPAPARPPAR